jgi:hypothetical protein
LTPIFSGFIPDYPPRLCHPLSINPYTDVKTALVSTLLFSAAGRSGHLNRYAELASHFKVQYLIGSMVCLLACLFYREPGWAVAAAVGMAINLAAVAPWYDGRKRTVGD